MPSKSTFPDLDIPEIDIWALLFERKELEFPEDKVIYRDATTSRAYTYQDVRNTAIDFGKGLKVLWEWKKGDVIGMYVANSIDTPAVIWGTHWAGGIISPANPGYTPEELAFQLKDSGAKALVTQKQFLKSALVACKKVGIPEDRIILLGDERDETLKFKHFTTIRNISGTSRYRRTKADPKNDLAFLVYSSGTTGHPKGVMLTHSNIVSNILMTMVGDGGNLNHKDKVLAFLPFFHIYGLTCLIHTSLYMGNELVVMSQFEIEKFCKHIQDNGITFAYVVPPVVLQLAKAEVVSKYNLKTLRMMNSGAAPLTRDLVDAVYKRLGVPVKQGYGLSETSPTTHMQPWEYWYTTIGSVGRMLPNQISMYVDDEGKEVSAGTTGELWIKGPNIFKGYLNNVEGTKNALSDDGYFKTGDIGYQDDKGNFFITDRVKELIKYKGFQVPPAELEGILQGHDEIDDVAVIGVYNAAQATEMPRAYVVAKKGVERSAETEKRIMEWLSAKVASHKRLRGGVRFVDTIPKNPSGKILRRILKQEAKAEQKSQEAKL